MRKSVVDTALAPDPDVTAIHQDIAGRDPNHLLVPAMVLFFVIAAQGGNPISCPKG